MISRDPRSGWKRLEETLGAIKPGETVTIETLAAECGLAHQTVEDVLNAAMEAEWFERRDDGVYTRRGHIERTTFSKSDGRATIVGDGVPRPKESQTPAARLGKEKT